MDDKIIAERILMVKALLQLYYERKISIDDAAAQIYFSVRDCPEAYSLIPSGSEIEVCLRAINQRKNDLEIDLFSIFQIRCVEKTNNGTQISLSIDSFGQAIVSVDRLDGETAVFRSSEGLSKFAVTLRLLVDLSSRWFGEFIDPQPSGDIIEFSVYANSGQGDKRLLKWVYGSQSIPPLKKWLA